MSIPSNLVQEFWDGDERPANWPDAIPWPVQIEELPLDWVQQRREELGLKVSKPSK